MKIPSATYRLQFQPRFNFNAAQKIISYLADLGVSDIYASPIFKSKKGSTHGYDVVDPTSLDPELGAQPDFENLIQSVQKHNLGWIQDIVPNHMAFDSENQFLMDVFENGPLSRYFNFFDVDWDHPYENLKGKVLAPFLGEYYGRCLDKKEIQLKFVDGRFTIHYYDLQFPLRIDSYLKILSGDLAWLENKLGPGSEELIKFLELTQTLKDLSAITDPNERYRLIAIIKTKLWKFYTSHTLFKEYFDNIINKINGNEYNLQSLEDLDRLLLDQFFRFSFWKVGNEELNYRRFFTINGLICLRMDQKEVFDQAHAFLLKLIREKKITGLRVDHVDGLYNPVQYLKRLRQEMGDVYIVVEKILDLKEDLPICFPIEGTTGYDFLNYLNSLFVDQRGERAFRKIYQQFTDAAFSYHDLVRDKKRLFMGRHMAGDIDNLAHLLKRILGYHRDGRDMTMYGIRRAIVEIMAQFPVYRTYICEDDISEADKLMIKEAAVSAKNLNPVLLHELNFIEKVLLLNYDEKTSEKEKMDWLHCAKRFQQFSVPLMAKGAEDTTFYIFNRLLSLNEVGGDPSQFGLSTKDFHHYILHRKNKWPHAMNTLATHDTKRGEDVRARLNVLSEIPKEWNHRIKLWSRINKYKKKIFGAVKAPERNDEYLIYQTLIGSFPFSEHELESFKTRVKDYIVKALREAKIYTAWIKPELAYEQGCIEFIEKILDPSHQGFLEAFLPFQKKIAHYGVFNSLSQTLIKLAAPGVPDTYQGSELWDFNLVDPDNRRTVDYDRRVQFLEEIKSQSNNPDFLKQLLIKNEDGKVKLCLIYKVLNLRRQFPDLFLKGEYIPIEISGTQGRHVVAVMRKFENQAALVITSRFLTGLLPENEFFFHKERWMNTALKIPQTDEVGWKDIFTNKVFRFADLLAVGDVLENFPVSLLIKDKTVS